MPLCPIKKYSILKNTWLQTEHDVSVTAQAAIKKNVLICYHYGLISSEKPAERLCFCKS